MIDSRRETRCNGSMEGLQDRRDISRIDWRDRYRAMDTEEFMRAVPDEESQQMLLHMLAGGEPEHFAHSNRIPVNVVRRRISELRTQIEPARPRPVQDMVSRAVIQTRAAELEAYPCKDEADLDMFFATPSERERIARAKAVCGRCAVRDACLEVALADKSLEGIWGGQTEDERKTIRRSARK